IAWVQRLRSPAPSSRNSLKTCSARSGLELPGYRARTSALRRKAGRFFDALGLWQDNWTSRFITKAFGPNSKNCIAPMRSRKRSNSVMKVVDIDWRELETDKS